MPWIQDEPCGMRSRMLSAGANSFSIRASTVRPISVFDSHFGNDGMSVTGMRRMSCAICVCFCVHSKPVPRYIESACSLHALLRRKQLVDMDLAEPLR